MITGRQVRAARALAGWTQPDLATAAGISVIAVKNIERGISDPRQSTIAAIERAFRDKGVVFLDIDDGGEGVQLRE
ncbi:MAG: helix-turn-helix transcriptional regulator [Bryobacterales bacterium]|nr:helix-turn-helix transcriptional regulator [Bryobacterales bacterium]